jgi:hypothetical protein
MTLKEALIAELDEISVSDTTVDKTLIDRGVTDSDGEYTATDIQKKTIDLCMVDILYRLYTRADISEGSFSKSHPDFLRKVQTRLLYLAKKHGLTEVLDALQDDTPTFNDASDLW